MLKKNIFLLKNSSHLIWMVFVSVFMSRFIEILSEERTQRGAPRSTRKGLIMGGGVTVRAAPPARPTDPATRVPFLNIRRTKHYFEGSAFKAQRSIFIDVPAKCYTYITPRRLLHWTTSINFVSTCFAKGDFDLSSNWES